jgi:hypothetical protein
LRIKSERDFWSGVMFIAIGIFFGVGAGNYSLGTSARPGPGYFPLMLSVLMAILGAIVLFKSLTIETEGGDKVGPFAWRPLLIVVASIIVFGLLLPRLGLFATVPILIVMVSWATTEFTWLGTIINAAVLTVFSWLVFVVGLKLTIPLYPAFLG